MAISRTYRARLPVLGLLALGAGLCLLQAATAQAREHLYGVIGHNGLLNCEILHWEDRRREAGACYQSLTRNPTMPPHIRAEAMWALGDVRSANNLFQTAVQSEPDNALIRLRWGELFLQTFQNQDALDLFDEALNIEPDNAWAHLGVILALDGSDPEVINEHMSAIMDNFASPPGARLRAMLQVLHATMERDDFDEARDMLADIRKLAEEEELPVMEINAYAGALAFMTLEDHLPHIEGALAEAPGYGDAWAIPGYFASITRRYHEAGEFYEQAVEVQPDHWVAHVELGQNHLRLNHVSDAIEHIQLAYEGDPFNPRTVNLLRLLDTFTQEFVLLNYPDPPAGPIPELTLRLHRDERDVLRPYAYQLAQDSIDLYSERYRFEPKEPIVIEIFPNHEDFVVRSIGMPGVGILGVTFGYLFAMDSPTGHPEESYHWGTTLWHEMAHVFTVTATEHKVPRWYSEGISVYEEWRSGPIPGRKIPLDVLLAMAENKFLSVAELDDGFMRPTYDGQVMVSYMQSGLVFEYIEQAFGFEPIVDMLYKFKDGSRAGEVIENTLGISIREFDQGFDDYIEAEFGDFLPHMKTFMEHHQASIAALQQGDYSTAVTEAESAIFIYPYYAEVDSPYVIIARAYAAVEDEENEFLALQTYWEIGGWAPRALMALADGYLDRDQPELAAEVLMDINYADPFNENLHIKLGDIYMDLGRHEDALTEFEVLLALDPLDKASANYRLANVHHVLGNEEQSMDYLMTALDIAPQYRPAQQLLLEMSN